MTIAPGYGSGHANNHNVPSVLILLDGTCIGEHKFKGDEHVDEDTGEHDPQEVSLHCKISEGRIGQAISVKFTTGAFHQSYANQQAAGTSLAPNVSKKQLTIIKL